MPQTGIVLCGQCPDQKGLVARLTSWIFSVGGNILKLDEHVEPVSSQFFIRVHWVADDTALSQAQLTRRFADEVATAIGMQFTMAFAQERPRMAIFVTSLSHCLLDILARYECGELAVDIPLIVSNHETLRPIAERMGISFYVFEINGQNKAEQEARELELLQRHSVDLVILARYMQVLSQNFVTAYPNRIINIHHSFLPAFAGAKPYHRAYERGVKIIGATAHYVTSDLDEGPIIEQDTARVSHADQVDDMVRKGWDLEKLVLSRAIFRHLNHQVLVHGTRTVVFG